MKKEEARLERKEKGRVPSDNYLIGLRNDSRGGFRGGKKGGAGLREEEQSLTKAVKAVFSTRITDAAGSCPTRGEGVVAS